MFPSKKILKRRIKELEAENKALRAQLTERHWIDDYFKSRRNKAQIAGPEKHGKFQRITIAKQFIYEDIQAFWDVYKTVREDPYILVDLKSLNLTKIKGDTLPIFIMIAHKNLEENINQVIYILVSQEVKSWFFDERQWPTGVSIILDENEIEI